MAIVKKSELYNKAERDYKKIQRLNDSRIRMLSADDRRSVLDECVPQIRKMLLPIFAEIRSKLSYVPGYDLVEYTIKKLREAAIFSLDLLYSAVTGKTLKVPHDDAYNDYVLAVSCGFCNTIWGFLIIGILRMNGNTNIEQMNNKAEKLVSILIAPFIEEAAKSVSLEHGHGYRYTAVFATLEFIEYVVQYSPEYGTTTMIIVRSISWMFHFFTLILQDLIPDKTFSFLLAVLCHMSWNAGAGAKIMAPVLPKKRKDEIWI